MIGYPTIAAGEGVPDDVKWSPLTRSVVQAGLSVGATMASSEFAASKVSIPSVAPNNWSLSSEAL